MATSKIKRKTSNDVAPLAFHIRSLRQWYGTHGISQEELAKLAGVTSRTISFYESRRSVPQPLVNLISLSLALKVPVERLLDPRHLNRLSSAVETRRQTLQRCDHYDH